jgi:hypothetical protein
VFSNPVKILQWNLPSSHRTQRVLFSSVHVYTLTRRPPGRVSPPQNVQQFCLLYPVPLCTCSMPTWQSSQNLSDSSSFFDSQQSPSSNAPQSMCSMPTWQSLYRTPKRFCLQLCLPPHSLASKVFSNLEVFLLSC